MILRFYLASDSMNTPQALISGLAATWGSLGVHFLAFLIGNSLSLPVSKFTLLYVLDFVLFCAYLGPTIAVLDIGGLWNDIDMINL